MRRRKKNLNPSPLTRGGFRSCQATRSWLSLWESQEGVIPTKAKPRGGIFAANKCGRSFDSLTLAQDDKLALMVIITTSLLKGITTMIIYMSNRREWILSIPSPKAHNLYQSIVVTLRSGCIRSLRWIAYLHR